MSSLDDLLGLLQKQQAFVKKHAQRVRRECADCTSKEVQWELFGMAIGAEEALAERQAGPDALALAEAADARRDRFIRNDKARAWTMREERAEAMLDPD